MQLKDILNKYDIIEAQNLYNKAVEVLSLITDEELGDIFTKYPALFSQLTNVRLSHEELLRDKDAIRQAIDVFIQTIESRRLTEDEYNAMTLDDLKDYMSYLESFINKKSPVLLKVIHEIEAIKNDSRN